MPLIIEYIAAALARAKYENIDGAEPYYGEVPGLQGVWATGKTLEECRENLREVIDGWIVVRLRKNLPIPVIDGYTIEEITRSDAGIGVVKKPVTNCLVLEGEDAIEFERYMNDPDDITPEGRELLRKAREDAEKMSLDEL